MGNVKHLAARSLIQQRLFDGLTEFRELEARITALESERERGDAFEVFAEAYLATQPVTQAKEVWPEKVIPPSLRKRLSLHSTDVGADGVIETQTGQLHGYQVKYRSYRAPLTWTETATFFGVTDRCGQRFLFTNSDDVSAVMEQRKDFYCIRGGDLDKLEVRDFEAIAAWLRGSITPRIRKQPQPHQQEALDAILPSLEKSDRATAIMACGTGKTLVALWVAERCSGRRSGGNILVLVPSLALLRQTLHEWLRETGWQNLSYLCVCSDPTVEQGTDELIVRQADLDFPVTTDPGVVHRFLEGKAPGEPPVKIVFSTYQSAREVARGLPEKFVFDLAIFDEAHKTAGREGRNFGFALEDRNLSIKKRLFLTATPRHYDVRKRDKEGEAKLLYSMDVPEVYGPVAHTLTFAEAARRGIICNYKVIISVITSGMVNDHVLCHGKVLVKGDEIHARQVANQLALKAAIKKHGVSKIFTFHRSVASAKSFTSNGGEGIGNHLPVFSAYHVNGTMPTAERDGLMTEFRAASKAVMSNARCLTEGVDVPAVDMVAFLTPKRSKVDIVQATGRAMRKADGKTTGYVLVPLFVEEVKGESIEDAVARAKFDEVWNVLQAMQEQDDVLADIICQMRQERGRTKSFDDTRFREKVEVLGPTVSLRALRQSIATVSIDELGVTWDERYGELKAFKERFGHCDVRRRWSENVKLATWVEVQRRDKASGRLRENRVSLLDSLGFRWDPHGADWDMLYSALLEFRGTHGHCNVPYKWPDNPSLGIWVHGQRSLRKKQQLGEERIHKLDRVGFVWDKRTDTWKQMFSALLKYKNTHGDCNVPRNWHDTRLVLWVLTQRVFKRRGKLSQERVDRLNEAEFVWDVADSCWEEMFARLVRYKEVHDDCNVPKDWHENPKLGSWVDMQRQLRKNERLSPEFTKRLEEQGFVWEPSDEKWETMFSQLLRYRDVHGDCNVPAKWSEDPKLGNWVGTQRTLRKVGRLSEERIQRLDEIGFVWDLEASLKSSFWEDMFRLLVDYKREHGHCNVPRQWETNLNLANWVSNQRQAKKRGKLSLQQIDRLDDLGFLWNPFEAGWEEMVSALGDYKRVHGNCDVSKSWP